MENSHRNKKCPACTKKYVSMSAAKKHIRKKHPYCTESPIILWQNGSAVPKSAKKKICKMCPHSPVFNNKAARRQHVRAEHNTECPICSVSILKQSLSGHLQKTHGVTGSAAQATNQTVPQFASNSTQAESSYATILYQTSGEVEESNRQANVSFQDNESSVLFGGYDVSPGWFYCQEYDCGRGFSSEAHLESHTRFFHPRKPTQTTPASLSSDTLDADEGSTEHSSEYFSPALTIGHLHPEESAIQDSPDPVETCVPVLRRGGYQGVELKTGEGVQQTHEGPLEPSTTSRTDVHVAPAVTTSTPLSLQCRMCDAPPTVGTRPTVTMCGHLFCSECITQHVMSTSKCPVCDGALLLYRLFKLDLPVSS